MFTNVLFSERELKKALRDTLTQGAWYGLLSTITNYILIYIHTVETEMKNKYLKFSKFKSASNFSLAFFYGNGNPFPRTLYRTRVV